MRIPIATVVFGFITGMCGDSTIALEQTEPIQVEIDLNINQNDTDGDTDTDDTASGDTGDDDTGDTGDTGDEDTGVSWEDMDDDGDEILNRHDLFMASDVGTTLLISERVFPESHRDCDAYWVGDTTHFGSWDDLRSDLRVENVDGWYQLVNTGSTDSGGIGLPSGTYQVTLVSACSLSNVAIEASPSDMGTWQWALYGSTTTPGLDTSFCPEWQDAFCVQNPNGSWSIRFTHLVGSIILAP